MEFLTNLVTHSNGHGVVFSEQFASMKNFVFATKASTDAVCHEVLYAGIVKVCGSTFTTPTSAKTNSMLASFSNGTLQKTKQI